MFWEDYWANKRFREFAENLLLLHRAYMQKTQITPSQRRRCRRRVASFARASTKNYHDNKCKHDRDPRVDFDALSLYLQAFELCGF